MSTVLGWIKTTVLTKEPNDWRKNYKKFRISNHGMSVAIMFVPQEIEINKETESSMIKEVLIYCN